MALLPQPPARLLDLGCGTGWTSAFFARRGYQVVGQDIARNMIDLAERNRLRYEAPTLQFIVSDYESLQFSEPFDCAVFFDALHHAEDERAALESVFRALKPGGVVITHEPGAGHSSSADAINAMRSYGVTEKDMPPSHIRKLCAEIGYSGFKFLLDPTQAFIAVYGINIDALTPVHRPLWRRVASLIKLMLDRRLDRGGVCVITK